MKTKPIPAIVMLSAGFVTCIIAIYTHMELMAFTKSLLLVLIVFYILGGIVKIILDKNFAQMKEEEEETADTEKTRRIARNGRGDFRGGTDDRRRTGRECRNLKG